MNHIKLKSTIKLTPNFDICKVTKGMELPLKSESFIEEYLNSTKISDEYDADLFLIVDDSIIAAFDYLYKGKKLAIPEVNPVMIFYSNALMTHKKLKEFKERLFEFSPEINQVGIKVNLNYFSDYFLLASNCIVNLQSAIECFINQIIPANYVYFTSKGSRLKRRPTIHEKIDVAVVKIKKINFKASYEQEYALIKKLVDLRNDIIHLKPTSEKTNTKYKDLFRRVVDFDFENTTIAVKKYINFYESNLIENCSCGKDIFYDIRK